jgi:hypothetical protein
MKVNRLLICLCCLGGMWLAGCIPTEVTPAAFTRAVEQAAATPPPAATATAVATAPAATATPDLATADLSWLTFTPTPDPALPTWTPMPLPTPTPTARPTATPPPLPGPVWRIQFRGQLCPGGEGDCSRYSDDLTHAPAEEYIINSDGSGFATLAEAGIFLADYGRFYLPPNPFSPDGLHLAFFTGSCIYLSDLAGTNPICLAPDGPFPSGYRFLPDEPCLMAYFRILEIPFAQVSLEKKCIDRETEVIGIFEFADLPEAPVHYQLSPQGDALLAHGRMADGELRLYVQDIGRPAPPHLLFTQPKEDLGSRIVAVRWLPDGKAIEFLLRTQPADTFYRVNRDDGDITTGVSLPEQFQAQLGDWSPDGRQFAFSHVEEDGSKSGLYLIDLQTGEWRQILSGFHMSSTRVRAWVSSEH